MGGSGWGVILLLVVTGVLYIYIYYTGSTVLAFFRLLRCTIAGLFVRTYVNNIPYYL